MFFVFFCQDHSQQAVEQDLKSSSLTLKLVFLTERRVQVTSSEWPTEQALNGRAAEVSFYTLGKTKAQAEKPNVTEQGKGHSGLNASNLTILFSPTQRGQGTLSPRIPSSSPYLSNPRSPGRKGASLPAHLTWILPLPSA